MTEYDKTNPLIVCKCGRKFRQHGYDRNGNYRIYTQCMTCTQEDFKKQTKTYAR